MLSSLQLVRNKCVQYTYCRLQPTSSPKLFLPLGRRCFYNSKPRHLALGYRYATTTLLTSSAYAKSLLHSPNVQTEGSWVVQCRPFSVMGIDPMGRVVLPLCGGCGAVFQVEHPNKAGFIPKEKWTELAVSDESGELEFNEDEDKDEEKEPKAPLTCQRCFNLKHYNNALNITLKKDDYLTHLRCLRRERERTLFLLMVDVVDFPSSIFPNLDSILPPFCSVLIVANKVDLLPEVKKQSFWQGFESTISHECAASSLKDCNIIGVHFISALNGTGVDTLADKVLKLSENRGNVYLLGCTNVGKSTLFNQLLMLLCGANPGELTDGQDLAAPAATVSRWPGTTLGLLRFPILSFGKRKRRDDREASRLAVLAYLENSDDAVHMLLKDEEIVKSHKLHVGALEREYREEEEAILRDIGCYEPKRKKKKKKRPNIKGYEPPQNRYWLCDTPGCINDAQLINTLTTEELRLALPGKAIVPRTVLLKPGQCMLLGGLARVDYTKGPLPVYLTVFAAKYLPVHVIKAIDASDVYSSNIGAHDGLLKVPFGNEERIKQFPPLAPRELQVQGMGWNRSAADVVLSSAGWAAVTTGVGRTVVLTAYTPNGNGIFCRQPALFPYAIIDNRAQDEYQETMVYGVHI